MTVDYQSFTIKSTPKEERRKVGVGDIYTNAAKCLECNEIIRSKNRHDYVSCTCGNLSVDGGSWYLRRGYKKENSFEELSENYSDI